MRFRQHQAAAQASTRRLLALFALVVVGLVLAVNGVLALVYRFTVPFAQAYPALFFETNTAVVLLFVLGGCWFETLRLREGGAHVARLAGARPVVGESGQAPSERLERRYLNVVQEMALASGYPAPAAWIVPRDDAINAFAAGWEAEDSVIAVTRGALERLTREELQGAVAHEFSHLVHGDTRLHMRLLGLVWGLQMLFGFGRMLTLPDEHGRRPAGLLFGLALMLVGSLGWAAGRLLQSAVSREREFLADASAVKYTRQVAGIGGTLRKIAQQAKDRSDALSAPQAQTLAHLYLAEPGGWTRWLRSHPSLRERLKRLYGREMLPLPAPALPAPQADEEASALPHLAGSGQGAAAQGDEDIALAPEATRHDATQNPQWRGRDERQREALERIARWNGPGELRAGLLGLVALADGGDAAWGVWQGATEGLSVAPGVRAGIEVLDVHARLQVLQLLGERARALSTDERRFLRAGLRHVARSPEARLWRLAVLARLGPARIAPREGLAARWPEALAATAALAPALALPPAVAARWRDESLQVLHARLRDDPVAPHPAARKPRPTHGLAPPVGGWAGPGQSMPSTDTAWLTVDGEGLHRPLRLVRAALRLRHVAPLQRPLLARAWVQALPSALLHDERVSAGLLLACLLLDTPPPPALGLAGGVHPPAVPTPVVAQARSL